MEDKVVAYDFGARLKEMRKIAGYTQKEVSETIGKHLNTVRKYESNTSNPPPMILRKMILLYNASAEYIMGTEDRIMISLDDISLDEQETILKLYNQFKSNKQKG